MKSVAANVTKDGRAEALTELQTAEPNSSQNSSATIVAHSADTRDSFVATKALFGPIKIAWGKTALSIATKLASVYGQNKAALQDLYLLSCEAGLSIKGKPALAQMLADELYKQGFTKVKVHAAAPSSDKPLNEMTVEIGNDKKVGYVKAYSTDKNEENSSLIPASATDDKAHEAYYNLPHNTFIPNKETQPATYTQIQVMNFIVQQRIEYQRGKNNPKNDIKACEKQLRYLDELEKKLTVEKPDGTKEYISADNMKQILLEESRSRESIFGNTSTASTFMQDTVLPLLNLLSHGTVKEISQISSNVSQEEIKKAKKILSGPEFNVETHKNDVELLKFVNNAQAVLDNPTQHAGIVIKKTIMDIEQAQTALNSASMQHIKKQIQDLRTQATAKLSYGYNNKATQIEQSVAKMPVLERDKLMENSDVKKALEAERTLPFMRKI